MDIFEFWSHVGPSETIHPADKEIFRRVKDHHFDLRCLPSPIAGPLRTAPVVLLYLAPGWKERDRRDARKPAVQEYYVRRRGGYEPLPERGALDVSWWVSRTKCFGEWEDIRSKIAALNIGAYHSARLEDSHLLAALPSSRMSIDWAQKVLFPQALRGEKVIICLRSAHFWGLSVRNEPFGHSLFAPPVTRAGHMKHGPARDRILKAVRGIFDRANSESPTGVISAKVGMHVGRGSRPSPGRQNKLRERRE